VECRGGKLCFGKMAAIAHTHPGGSYNQIVVSFRSFVTASTSPVGASGAPSRGASEVAEAGGSSPASFFASALAKLTAGRTLEDGGGTLAREVPDLLVVRSTPVYELVRDIEWPFAEEASRSFSRRAVISLSFAETSTGLQR
jgi:hypothetical protein